MENSPVLVKPREKRYDYLDLLRVLACFLVIVNHTNVIIFTDHKPTGLTWYASLAYHYVSRMDISLFVLISGACLMGRVDRYRVIARRVVRIVLLLLVFSIAQYFYAANYQDGFLPVLSAFPAFLLSLWNTPAAGSYWYLYMYLGILVMLPFLQRMVQGMTQKRDYHVFFAVWLVVVSAMVWGSHFLPAILPSSDFALPLYTDFIGLLIAGHYIHRYMPVKKKWLWLSAALWVVCIVVPVLLTRREYDIQQGDISFLFLDWRIKPSTFMLISAMCAMYMAKAFFERFDHLPGKAVLRELSACTLFVYLTHHVVLALTQRLVYLPLADRITALPAMVLWELLVFLICVLVAIPLRRLPGLRKILS